MKMKVIVILLMLVFSLGPIVSAAPPNTMGFALNPKDVTVGDSFTTLIWVDVNSAIDTASADNLTFLPAGVVNYSSVAQGNLFAGSLVWITPEGGGTINNVAGWAKPIVWGYSSSVNSVNRTLATITWNAVSCGVVVTTITEGGTAFNGTDPGTSKTTGTINVHPKSTAFFTATTHNETQNDLTWTKREGGDTTVIRYSGGGYPTTPTSGTGLYNGTGSSTTHGGLSPGQHVYYSAWHYNATANLYSIAYQEDDATTTPLNSPPVFGTPSPTNGSIGQNLALTWSIPITDPDGDDIDYRISCSNGDFIDVAGAINGTKSLSLTGLSYSTLYTIWVNATDPAGSGLYTRDVYTFTTKANNPPGAPTPDPTNGSICIDAGNNNLEVTSTDPDGHSLTVDFYWGDGTLIDTVTGASGTEIAASVTLLEYTNYSWYVNVSDGYGGVTRGPTAGNWTFSTCAVKKGGSVPGKLNELLITALFGGKPLPGAIILIYQGVGTQTVVATADTDADGIKSFSLPDGTYTIHIASPGLQEQTKTVTLTGNMAVIFNLQELGAADYLVLGFIILLLIIGLYLIYTVIKDKTYFVPSVTILIAIILDAVVIVLGFYYFWLLAVAGVALLIAEILWLRTK